MKGRRLPSAASALSRFPLSERLPSPLLPSLNVPSQCSGNGSNDATRGTGTRGKAWEGGGQLPYTASAFCAVSLGGRPVAVARLAAALVVQRHAFVDAQLAVQLDVVLDVVRGTGSVPEGLSKA